jgi:sterol desaturase/sphingolipid hydroxylase (fatty acid hydroxylase superfamily)
MNNPAFHALLLGGGWPGDVVRLFVIILGRYFLVAGACFWGLQARRQAAPAPGGTEGAWTPASANRHDILLATVSALIFALAASLLLVAQRGGLAVVRFDTAGVSLWSVALSYGLVLVLQDTGFYFCHRLFHRPGWFRWLHRGHHLSRVPTPWTSFAFDPGEAAVQAILLLAILLLIPLHAITLMALLITMTAWAVINHIDPDHLPASFPHHWLGRWFIGPAHHSRHHRHPDRNFGLYFTFWDFLMGTEEARCHRLLPGGGSGSRVPLGHPLPLSMEDERK